SRGRVGGNPCRRRDVVHLDSILAQLDAWLPAPLTSPLTPLPFLRIPRLKLNGALAADSPVAPLRCTECCTMMRDARIMVHQPSTRHAADLMVSACITHQSPRGTHSASPSISWANFEHHIGFDG